MDFLQFDWCFYPDDRRYFLNEEELDNCVTERILRNQFKDPMISSDDESEEERPVFDWKAIFSGEQKKGSNYRNFVPGLRNFPPYPKLSALTMEEQYRCLKVLCAKSPYVLEGEYLPRPTKDDYKIFEDVQVTYAKEQKEFMDWAKNIWTTMHCIRALRPKPLIETAYNAELDMKAKEMESFPKKFRMAAQIPLKTTNDDFDMVCEKELIRVDISDLPEIINPHPIKKELSIMVPCAVPEPCTKHPCRFVLPNELSTTILPLTEVHNVLAQYALDNGADHIASEKALKCLVEVDRGWTINLSVCEALTIDGEKRNVLVLGGELMMRKEIAQIRTYRAFKHLIKHTLVPKEEQPKLRYKRDEGPYDAENPKGPTQAEDTDESSDDDGFNLFIADEEAQMDNNSDTEQIPRDELVAELKARPQKATKAREKKKNEFYSCTCEDTLYERPPPRSFNKWRLKNLQTQEHYAVIVHCSHKLKDKECEILLEPIPEYQLDLGLSQLSEERHRSFALSLNLRDNATLMMVRVDGSTGEVVRSDVMNYDQHAIEHGEQTSDIAQTIAAALGQLRHLVPGHYLLHHEVSHGHNALLYAAGSGDGETLSLDFESTSLTDVDESLGVKTPPKLEPTLLPLHKFRKILPLAFTPFERLVVKETKKPPAKQRQPPSAIALDAEAEGVAKVKWPRNKKIKGKKGKKKP